MYMQPLRCRRTNSDIHPTIIEIKPAQANITTQIGLHTYENNPTCRLPLPAPSEKTHACMGFHSTRPPQITPRPGLDQPVVPKAEHDGNTSCSPAPSSAAVAPVTENAFQGSFLRPPSGKGYLLDTPAFGLETLVHEHLGDLGHAARDFLVRHTRSPLHFDVVPARRKTRRPRQRVRGIRVQDIDLLHNAFERMTKEGQVSVSTPASPPSSQVPALNENEPFLDPSDLVIQSLLTGSPSEGNTRKARETSIRVDVPRRAYEKSRWN